MQNILVAKGSNSDKVGTRENAKEFEKLNNSCRPGNIL